MSRRTIAAGVGLCAAAFAPSALSQPFEHYSTVPLVHTQSPHLFSSLFRSARCGTVRALMLGDSNETCPGGQGVVYVTRFNYELWARYGNAPETPYAQMMASTGGGSPWAEWLWIGARGEVTASRVATDRIPPGFTACKTTTGNGNNINNNQWLGQLVMLQHDAAAVDPRCGIAGTAEFFRRGTNVYLDVLGFTNESSGEVSVRVVPNPTRFANYYLPTSALFTTAMGLESPVPAVIRQRVGPLPFNGQPYLQVELTGTSASKFTDILACKFINEEHPRGWVVDDAAAGGYSASSFLQNHGNCGAVLSALAPDVVFLCFGTNDALNTPAAQYGANVMTLIAQLRAWIRPDLPVILLGEPYQSRLNAAQEAQFDLNAGVNLWIAQQDPLVCAVNSRRSLHAQGWAAGTSSFFLIFDGVHYTGAGAIAKAYSEVDLLYSAFGAPCVADADGDCGVTIDDLLAYLAAFDSGHESADVDDGEGNGTPDGGVTIEDLLYFLWRFDQGC